MTGGPGRQVLHQDALPWLAAHPAWPGASLLTSLPDVSEAGLPPASWPAFFAEAARLCLLAVPDDGVAVFFQTDNRHEGRQVSKAAMVLAAAAALDLPLVWHQVVLRRPPGTKTMGRPGYSHLLAFSRRATLPVEQRGPDVLPDLGEVDWSHGMGRAAAAQAVAQIRRASPSTTLLLAPFCGLGVALSAANEAGLEALGIERNRKRAEKARGPA
ncbi:SAM-dependent methyltransferase [Myxococcota bacterium]|nr:SAM-dependent methyltransferase [Myxococcota bacterium]